MVVLKGEINDLAFFLLEWHDCFNVGGILGCSQRSVDMLLLL